MSQDMREAVARALYKADSGFDPDANVFEGKPAWAQYEEQADAAIAAMRPMLLEEAAKVALDARDAWAEVWMKTGSDSVVMQAHIAGAETIAAAIRAMKDKP